MSPALTTAAKVTILKHLIAGRDTAWIIAATNHSTDDILAVKRDHGYPNPDGMQRALAALQGLLDRQAEPPRRATPSAPAGPIGRIAAPTPAPAPASPLEDTLRAGLQSDRARTRKLATSIAALLGRLEETLRDETEAARAAKAQAAEQKRISDEIARLQAQIDALRSKKIGQTKTRGAHPCGQCDKVFDTPQGAAGHRRMAHEGFRMTRKAGAA